MGLKLERGEFVLRFAGRASEECSALEASEALQLLAVGPFSFQARMRRVGAVVIILTNSPAPRGWDNWD